MKRLRDFALILGSVLLWILGAALVIALMRFLGVSIL
jgi:hypothetical protein